MSLILACFVKAQIWTYKSHAAILIGHLASTTNPSSNIIIEEHELSVCTTRNSILLCKIEFVDHMHVNEQGCQWLFPQNNPEKRYNVYKM